jgi:hypothetical protein
MPTRCNRWLLLQILLLAQHVSGTTMPIIRSSPQTGHIKPQLHTIPTTWKPNTTGSSPLYNTLELLMMGMVVPETCWASNKICNKNHMLHLVGILFPHINDDADQNHFKSLLNVLAKCSFSGMLSGNIRIQNPVPIFYSLGERFRENLLQKKELLGGGSEVVNLRHKNAGLCSLLDCKRFLKSIFPIETADKTMILPCVANPHNHWKLIHY